MMVDESESNSPLTTTTTTTTGRSLLLKNQKELQAFVRRNDTTTFLVRTRVQSVTGFAEVYDDDVNDASTRRMKHNVTTTQQDNHEEYHRDDDDVDEPIFSEVYHDVWRIFFRPSPAVATLVEQKFQVPPPDRPGRNDLLVPGRYTAVHLRALYGRRTFRKSHEVQDLTQNALNCASQLQPGGGPFFFASDLQRALELAVLYGQTHNVTVHVASTGTTAVAGEAEPVVENTTTSNKPATGSDTGTKTIKTMNTSATTKYEDGPLHLAKAKDLHLRGAHEFYPTFVDLWILGMGRCTVVNRGGFGTFGALIGYNSTCLIHQKTTAQGPQVRCNWANRTAAVLEDKWNGRRESAEDVQLAAVPLFLDPMP